MYPKQRKMSQGIAVFAAILFLLMAVLTINWISENAENYMDWGGDTQVAYVIYQYVCVAAYALVAIAFFRQVVDKTLGTALKFFVFCRVVYGLAWCFTIGDAMRYYYNVASGMMIEILPFILLACCCSEKDEGKSVKGAVITTVLLFVGVLADLVIRLNDVPAESWLEFDVMVEEILPQLAHSLAPLTAAVAIKSAVGGQATQQPANQQPTYQQPAYQQPTYQQPAYQQPAYQQPAYQQPAYQQPAYQQPAYQQPAYQQPAYQQPAYQQPAAEQPAAEQPAQQTLENQ